MRTPATGGLGRAAGASLGAAILFHGALAPAETPVELREAKGRLEVTAGGRPLATYMHGDALTPRPFFVDLHAPGGVRVTRRRPPGDGDLADHASYHPGLFLAFGDLGGADFWRNRGCVVHERYVEPPAGGDGKGTFSVRNRYEDAEGRAVAFETCRYTFLVRPAGYWLLWDSTFEAARAGVAFGDQEEMGLGVRVHTPLNVRGGRGRILNSRGERDEKGTWGRVAEWCDYSGPAAGMYAGILLVPHPANFRASWFHARDYGLLVANPFGRKALSGGSPSRIELPAGKPLRLRFAVLLHAGPNEASLDLNAAYREYVEILGEDDPPVRTPEADGDA